MQFQYQYKTLAADEIRLLRLRPGDSNVLEGELLTCRLLSEEPEDAQSPAAAFRTDKDVVLVESGAFDALTYCWSEGEPTTHITIYDEKDLEFPRGNIRLKPNLEAALRTFRASIKPLDDLQYFWIDAICIDQGNKLERSAQIQKIPAIYNQANIVRIWLGTATHKSDIAMDFIEELVKLDDIDKLSEHVPTDYKWAAFRDLMRREWFHRRWIIQEVALARKPIVYCGAKTVPWETFTYAVSLFTSKASQLKWLFKQSKEHNFDPDSMGELDALGAKILVDISNNIFRKHDDGEIVEHLLSLEALMSILTMFQASSPHDTVYAILWLAHDATPRATRKPAASFTEITDTPHPSPRLRPRNMPPIIQTEEHSPESGLDSQVVSDSPTAVTADHSMRDTTLSHQPGNANAPQSLGAQGPQWLKPPEHERRRRRSNSWALLTAEKDIKPEPKPIEVDYDKDIFTVYSDFTEFVISRSRSLDIICRPWASTPTNGKPDDLLPSWIPQLSGSPYALVPHTMVYQRVRADPLVGTPGTGVRTYNTCGKQRAFNTDSTEPFIIARSLLARGFLLDTLDRVEDKATLGAIPSSWLDIVDWQDPAKPMPEAFWRTLVADRDLDGHSIPPAYFPLACKWAFNRRTQHYDLDTNRLLHYGRCPELCFKFLRRVQAVVWHRRLSLTSGSIQPDNQRKTPQLLCLIPATAQKGDLVCVLYGCSVPVVLRKREPVPVADRLQKRKAEPVKPQKKGTLKTYKRPRLSLNAGSDPGSGALLGQGLQFAQPQTSPPLQTADADASFWSRPPYTNDTIPGPSQLSTSPELHASTPMGAPEPRIPETILLPNLSDDEQYELIGECYVHGMMAGEAFKHRVDTGNAVKEFRLV